MTLYEDFQQMINLAKQIEKIHLLGSLMISSPTKKNMQPATRRTTMSL